MQLLHIDSSVLGPNSASRALSAEIVAKQVALHPGIQVIHRDLAADAALHLSPAHLAAWQGAGASDGAASDGAASGGTASDGAASGGTVSGGAASGGTLSGGAVPHSLFSADLAKGSAYLEELQAANIIVIGAPMYNFSIPSQLKAWIDRVVIAGKTFRYGPNGAEGLLSKSTKVYIASSRGNVYAAGSPSLHSSTTRATSPACCPLLG